MTKMPQSEPDGQHPKVGETHIFLQPPVDPACTDHSCEIDRPDLVFPWINLVGKRVTVTETGHTYAGHPAVKVVYGPVDWHPKVMVTLTPEQVQSLGLLAVPGAPFAITGMVWAITDPDDVPATVTDTDDFPFWAMTPADIPFQRSEIVPVSCLVSTVKPPVPAEVRRREARLRRLATKQGLMLRKTRVQAPYRAGSTGPYLLLEPARAKILPCSSWDVGLGRGMSLDQVESALHKQREHQL
ncbi:hypothetical protein ACFYZB_04120 [Streptomyces sp. NPDC001852]|uniref:hypothetical protein n=1 Tax=Streptomyces sp. NPDC001852 TaxID=3364619 RepID=UPI0036A78C39